MDIPKSLTDLANLAKDVILQNDAVEEVKEKVEEVAEKVDTAIEKVEDLASEVGMGDKVEEIVNNVEEKTGFDVDQDGDVAKE